MMFTRAYAKIHTPGQFSPSAMLDQDNWEVTPQDYPILRNCEYTVNTPALDNAAPTVLTPFTLRSIDNPTIDATDSITLAGTVRNSSKSRYLLPF